jgi:uncharacterized alkaline shock family protein YloU
MVILFIVTMNMFIGAFALLFISKILTLESVNDMFNAIYVDERLQLTVGVFAVLLLLMDFVLYNFFSVNVHRDKIIAFDNPSGRVTFSLMAMEDIVKRMLLKNSAIADAKIKIIARKKGLEITIKLMLSSEVNIPDITAKVQNMVKNKIQDMIGLEEALDISIYIGKVVMKQKSTKKGAQDEEESAPNIPFQGYRA